MKRQKLEVGQVLALPLCDGSFGVAHLAAFGVQDRFAPTFVLFGDCFSSPEAIVADLEMAMLLPIATIVVSGADLEDRRWPVIASVKRDYSFDVTAQYRRRGISHSDNVAAHVIEAYNGLIVRKLEFFRQMLLPGLAIPAAALNAVPRITAPVPPPPPVVLDEDGEPRPLHIRIPYTPTGKGLPTPTLVRRRQALAHAIEAAGVGEVVDAGGGGGVIDVHVEPKKEREAVRALLWAFLDSHKLIDGATIDGAPRPTRA